MNKNLGILLFIILLSCTKSKENNSSNSVKQTIVSYTVTDTLGVKWAFSDTSFLKDSQYINVGNTGTETRFPCGLVEFSQDSRYFPDTFNFIFTDFKTVNNAMGHNSSINGLNLYLPYYQSNLSEKVKFNNSLFHLVLNATTYSTDLVDIYPQKLTNVNMQTTISDSSDNYLTGSFNITATTQFSKQIEVSGVFRNIPTNFPQ